MHAAFVVAPFAFPGLVFVCLAMLNKFHYIAAAGVSLSLLIGGLGLFYLTDWKVKSLAQAQVKAADASSTVAPKLLGAPSNALLSAEVSLSSEVSSAVLLAKSTTSTLLDKSTSTDDALFLNEVSLKERNEENLVIVPDTSEGRGNDVGERKSERGGGLVGGVNDNVTFVFEDFVPSTDPCNVEMSRVPTEAEKSEEYVNLARKYVLENESPKRGAARQEREENLRVKIEEEEEERKKKEKALEELEEERRNLIRTAASEAATVASVHLLATSRGGGSLRSPLRGGENHKASPRRVIAPNMATNDEVINPKKLSEEFAIVASPKNKGSARKQILSEMKRLGHHKSLTFN